MQSRSILRILDANLDRAREGIRVVEEWFRLGQANGKFAHQCKVLRQQLADRHTPAMHAARDTLGDPGTQLDHPGEAERRDPVDLLRVNFARVQEALRVIEEYAKLIDPSLAGEAKQWRYQVYVLQSAALGADRRAQLDQARLYLVTAPHPRLLDIVEQALGAGLRLVQLREKDLEARAVLDLALRLRELCTRHGALFIVNDRVDLALASDADGVHLGQTDLPIAHARLLLGPHLLIGQSTHHPDEAARALTQGADYIGMGPVYATPTKQGRTPVGLDYVRHCREIALPGYAIGGIDLKNITTVLAGGAERVAVVRALMDAHDPARATAEFLEHLYDHGQSQR